MIRNSKRAIQNVRNLLDEYLRTSNVVKTSDALEILRRAGVQFIDKQRLSQAVERLGQAHEFVHRLETEFGDLKTLRFDDALYVLEESQDVNAVDKKTFLDAVIHAGEADDDPDENATDEGHEPETLAPHHQKLAHVPYRYERHKKPETSSSHSRTGGNDSIRVKVSAAEPHSEVIEVDAVQMRDGRVVYTLEEEPSETLVIHCGDARFQKAFRTFLTEELGIETYTPIVIGGGLHAFGVQSILPKNFKILWQQIKFFVKEANLKRIIFINHDDCQWYKKMHLYRPKLGLTEQGVGDLRTAAERMIEDFSGIDVQTYFARIVDGKEIEFERVS